jgi:hypothetical protein
MDTTKEEETKKIMEIVEWDGESMENHGLTAEDAINRHRWRLGTAFGINPEIYIYIYIYIYIFTVPLHWPDISS